MAAPVSGRAAGLVLLLACAAWAGPRNPKPDWVDGSSAEHPRERYLVGIGLGDDRASAEDRARGEISKIFQTVVTVNTNLAESETNISAGKKSENTFSQAISQSVQTASKKALEGVQVVENWKDESTMQHYALAVLERAKGVRVINDKISEFDKQALQWKGQMDQAQDKLARVKAAMKLLALLKARTELNSELRVLDDSGKAVPTPFDETEVRPQAAKAVSELDVVVDIK